MAKFKRKFAYLWGYFVEVVGIFPYEFEVYHLAPYFIVMSVLTGVYFLYQESRPLLIMTVVFQILTILIALKYIVSIVSFRLSDKILDVLSDSLAEFYLNGYQVWDYYDTQFFSRLGHYIGHGLCYESSALLMMLFRDKFNIRIIFGSCFSDQSYEMVDHCWVEVKHLGIWWAIDPIWYSKPLPIPRALFCFSNAPVYERIIEDKEFFSPEITRIMYQFLKKPETSYLLHNLVFFRRAIWKNDRDKYMVHELFGEDYLDDLDGFGERDNIVVPDAFSSKKLVTQRIINEFLTNEHRKQPKAHTFRKANFIMKKVKQAREEYDRTHPKEPT